MGREARCLCRWAGEEAECKVLLESRELIVRGGIRRTTPIASLTNISVRDGWLRFRAESDDVMLKLGEAAASRWAKAITVPPPSLAHKLGISRDSHLWIIGELESSELQAAVGEAASADGKNADLILACVKTSEDMHRLLHRSSKFPAHAPVWVVYAKGGSASDKSGRPGESSIRAALRSEGFIDTKIASVSETLTALRFIRRA